MGMMKIERFVDAPKEVVWTVISDLEGYADAAPNLTRAVIESGQGEGMKRRCWDTRGGTWQEERALWGGGRELRHAGGHQRLSLPICRDARRMEPGPRTAKAHGSPCASTSDRSTALSAT